MLKDRIGIYIYFKHNKFIRQLKRHGHVVYVNTNKQYMLIYIDESELEDTLRRLSNLKYVTEVLVSEYKNIKLSYPKGTV